MAGGVGQPGGEFLAEAGFLGAAGRPEEAGIALAARGGPDEAYERRGGLGRDAVRRLAVGGWRRGREQGEQGVRHGGGAAWCVRCEDIPAVGGERAGADEIAARAADVDARGELARPNSVRAGTAGR